MHHDDSHSDCVAATTKGIDCPSALSSFGMAIFHLNSYIFFSSAVFGDNVLSSVLLLAGLMLFVGLMVLSYRYSIRQYAIYRHSQISELQPSPFKEGLLLWFSLHENSPTIS